MDEKEKELGVKLLKVVQEYSEYLSEKERETVQRGNWDYFLIDLPKKSIDRFTWRPVIKSNLEWEDN